MMRASLWAAAVVAFGAPRRAFIRRKYSPKNVSLRWRLCAAIPKARAARFFVGRVLDERTLPPLTRLSGQSRSHEAKADTDGKRERSGPISLSRTCAVRELIPGACVRSTPNTRYRSFRRPLGSLRYGVFRGLRVMPGANQDYNNLESAHHLVGRRAGDGVLHVTRALAKTRR